MSLRWRPLRPRDVATCVEIVASHPVIAPRYGSAIENLRSVWLSLLGRDAMTHAVFEEIDRTRTTVLGFGIGVFVRDDFVREVKTSPLFWFGPELSRRIAAGNSPVLTDEEVREANSHGGLTELVWETLTWPQFAGTSEIYHLMGRAYVEIHRGFLFKEMITTQAESVDRLRWAVDAGGLYWDPETGSYAPSLNSSPEQFIREPHVVGITRELEFSRPGRWVGTLFNHRSPQVGFTRAEQQLLIAALDARTDQELSNELSVSVPTVKKTWTSIYNRAAAALPDLFPPNAHSVAQTPERGKEKRRRLLSYLREHPEELRPHSHKAKRQHR